MSLARPKSSIFRRPSGVRRMFPGFYILWTTPSRVPRPSPPLAGSRGGRPTLRHRPLAQPRLQRLTRDVFHDEEINAFE